MQIMSVSVFTNDTDRNHRPLVIAAGFYHPKRSTQSFLGRLGPEHLSFSPRYLRSDLYHPPQQPCHNSSTLLREFIRSFYRHHRVDAVLIHGEEGRRLFTQALRHHLIAVLPKFIDITELLKGQTLDGFSEQHHLANHFPNPWQDHTSMQQKLLYLTYATLNPHWWQEQPSTQRRAA